MTGLLSLARKHEAETVAIIRKFVECESPSGDAVAIGRFVDLLAESVRDIARVKTFAAGKYGKHVRCEFTLPGGKKSGQILALGHSDTVWPLGSLKTMPFHRARGRIYGPGVFDMKAGLALMITAVRMLRELEAPIARKVVLQVNADEEIGSPSSRALTEEAARASVGVLVLEPAAGLDGKLKTARKGVGDYTVIVKGIPAHAGLDFEKGANAIVEMARQIERIAGFTRLDRGVTVSPGVIVGGTRSNVVPDSCKLEVDVRIPRAADARYLEARFRNLKAFDKRCTVEVTGGINRPPLERTAGVRKLYGIAEAVAAELGISIGECAVGGGSDGNFTAGLGVPTHDGLGAIGEGAHSANENIVAAKLPERAAFLANLLTKL
ncbi:MAG: M20 family metallopeptidase [Bryobacteraceae bacterium]